MLSAELLIKYGYLNFIKNAFANEAAAVLWHATCYTQHATCYIINVNIFMRLPPPATDCNCNAACFGNNMQILITVSAVFALKIANIYSTVCRCVCAGCILEMCIVCYMQISWTKHRRWNLGLDYIHRSIDCTCICNIYGLLFQPESIENQSIYLFYLLHTHTHME